MNSLTHYIDELGQLQRKPAKEGKRKKRKGRKIVPAKGKTSWGRIYADGREVCDLNTRIGASEYGYRKGRMWLRDAGMCCICGNRVELDVCEFEHRIGRGMNGSHRDDRIKDNGVAHHDCNSKKGSKRA